MGQNTLPLQSKIYTRCNKLCHSIQRVKIFTQVLLISLTVLLTSGFQFSHSQNLQLLKKSSYPTFMRTEVYLHSPLVSLHESLFLNMLPSLMQYQLLLPIQSTHNVSLMFYEELRLGIISTWFFHSLTSCDFFPLSWHNPLWNKQMPNHSWDDVIFTLTHPLHICFYFYNKIWGKQPSFIIYSIALWKWQAVIETLMFFSWQCFNNTFHRIIES